jgi:hypothetical protein
MGAPRHRCEYGAGPVNYCNAAIISEGMPAPLPLFNGSARRTPGQARELEGNPFSPEWRCNMKRKNQLRFIAFHSNDAAFRAAPRTCPCGSLANTCCLLLSYDERLLSAGIPVHQAARGLQANLSKFQGAWWFQSREP